VHDAAHRITIGVGAVKRPGVTHRDGSSWYATVAARATERAFCASRRCGTPVAETVHGGPPGSYCESGRYPAV